MAAMETTERSPHVLEESRETHRRPVGFVVVAIVALVVGCVAGWLLRGWDSDATSTVPAGVEELLADYTGAWENGDVDTFREIVTDDFVTTEYRYQVAANLTVVTFTKTADQVATVLGRPASAVGAYQIEQGGKPIVAGDGPWYVSVQETWTERVRETDGTATYLIVADQDGALKIAGRYLIGLEE